MATPIRTTNVPGAVADQIRGQSAAYADNQGRAATSAIADDGAPKGGNRTMMIVAGVIVAVIVLGGGIVLVAAVVGVGWSMFG